MKVLLFWDDGTEMSHVNLELRHVPDCIIARSMPSCTASLTRAYAAIAIIYKKFVLIIHGVVNRGFDPYEPRRNPLAMLAMLCCAAFTAILLSANIIQAQNDVLTQGGDTPVGTSAARGADQRCAQTSKHQYHCNRHELIFDVLPM